MLYINPFIPTNVGSLLKEIVLVMDPVIQRGERHENGVCNDK